MRSLNSAKFLFNCRRSCLHMQIDRQTGTFYLWVRILYLSWTNISILKIMTVIIMIIIIIFVSSMITSRPSRISIEIREISNLANSMRTIDDLYHAILYKWQREKIWLSLQNNVFFLIFFLQNSTTENKLKMIKRI